MQNHRPIRNRNPKRPSPMTLKILLPSEIFVNKTDVVRIVAETPDGSFGLLPHRLDCVAALAPGILTYETKEDGTVYLAVDEGVLVKTGRGCARLRTPCYRRYGPQSAPCRGEARVSDTWTQRSESFVLLSPKWRLAWSAV